MSKNTRIYLLVSALSAGAFGISLLLQHQYNEAPCPYCIAQRALYALSALPPLAAIMMGYTYARYYVGLITTLLAPVMGLGVALYQSWAQRQPGGMTACLGEPSAVEQTVEYLANLAPAVFMPTGFCANIGLAPLGLTLANWSALGFFGLIALLSAVRRWPMPDEQQA